MPYPKFSIDDTRNLVVALGKALFPSQNFGSRRSSHGKRATFLSAAVSQVESHVVTAERDLHPLTAGQGAPLNNWCFAVQVQPKEASPARGDKAGRVRGNAGIPITPGLQLRHPQSGLLFAIANSTTVAIPGTLGVDPDSFFDCDIVGVDVGSQTRLDAGQTLNFLSPPLGLEGEVTLVADLAQDGFDAEQFGSQRARFLGALGNPKAGGSQADFVGWIEASLPAVQKGFAYPNRNGRGTIDLVGFYAAAPGNSRALSSDDRASVLAYVQTKEAFQGLAGTRVITTIPDQQRVELQLTPNGLKAYAFDWATSTPATVGGWTPATRELQFTGGALPPALRAGHRVILVGTNTGSGVAAQDGREYKVQAISAVDKVILDSAPPIAPAATDLIYSGGPLVTPVRDAIVAHLNGEIVYAGTGRVPIPASQAFPDDPNGQSIIGLDALAEGVGPANPAGKYGTWNGGIIRAVLFQIATYKQGVLNATVVAPATDYQPADDGISDGQPFTANTQIHYIAPGVVIVRSA